MKKKVISLDTNVVQSLYLFMSLGEKAAIRKMNGYTEEQFNMIRKLIKNLDKYELRVTPTVFAEVEKATSKYPDIVKFIKTNLHISKPKDYSKSPLIKKHIEALRDEYIKSDIYLGDNTHTPQQARSFEVKNGKVDYTDALIIAENNVLFGCPFFTLNEKHLVGMNEADNKQKPLRSRAILNKNKKYLKLVPHKFTQIRKNLKRPHATTYRISRVFDKELFM